MPRSISDKLYRLSKFTTLPHHELEKLRYLALQCLGDLASKPNFQVIGVNNKQHYLRWLDEVNSPCYLNLARLPSTTHEPTPVWASMTPNCSIEQIKRLASRHRPKGRQISEWFTLEELMEIGL